MTAREILFCPDCRDRLELTGNAYWRDRIRDEWRREHAGCDPKGALADDREPVASGERDARA